METKEIIEFLEKVSVNLEGWGEYVSPYFQEKYDLKGDIKEIDDFIDKLKS